MQAHDLDRVTPLPLPLAPSGYQGVATVRGEEPGQGWWVDDGRQRRLARRAASCLLAPAVGDRVWVVGEVGHGPYVTAVLERAEAKAPATLAFDGDVAVSTRGRLTLTGGNGLDLHTPQDLGVSAGELHVQARTGRAAFEELSVLARRVFASMLRVTRVGEVLELLVDRVVQRSKHSVRAIEGVDRTQAQTVEIRAEGTAHVQATHALVNGTDLVKMDGGQIHLG